MLARYKLLAEPISPHPLLLPHVLILVLGFEQSPELAICALSVWLDFGFR